MERVIEHEAASKANVDIVGRGIDAYLLISKDLEKKVE